MEASSESKDERPSPQLGTAGGHTQTPSQNLAVTHADAHTYMEDHGSTFMQNLQSN